MPRWLRDKWKRISEVPQSGTLEERALWLLRLHVHPDDERKEDREKYNEWVATRNKFHKSKKPNLLQALVLDLLIARIEAAAANAPLRPFDDPVMWLVQSAMGLPKEHEPGNWTLRELEKRGRRQQEIVQERAQGIADQHKHVHGEPISQRELSKKLKAEGFTTSTSTIRTWISKKLLKL